MVSGSREITALLKDVDSGRPGAMDALLAAAYDELRAAARKIFLHSVNPGRPGATLQPTALVHEAFLRVFAAIRNGLTLETRGHFFTVYVSYMRRVLVDHVRGQKAEKRGRGRLRVPLDAEGPATQPAVDLLELDDVLKKLEARDAHKAKLVELRLFLGMTAHEAAETLGVSVATVERDWAFARAWLRNELGEE